MEELLEQLAERERAKTVNNLSVILFSTLFAGIVLFTNLLQVAFIVLKLAGTIDWNWFWVIGPSFFGTSALVVVVLGMSAWNQHIVNKAGV